jgi:hypothetical protein
MNTDNPVPPHDGPPPLTVGPPPLPIDQTSSTPIKERKNADWWARSLSILTLIVTLTGLYLTNFYIPEDLIVSITGDRFSGIGQRETKLNLVLTNRGKTSVPVDKVMLLFFYGPTIKFDTAAKKLVSERLASTEIENPDSDRPNASEIKLSDSTVGHMVMLNPTRASINNVEAPSAAVLVETSKVALASYNFPEYLIDLTAEQKIIVSVALHYFDHTGKGYWKVVLLGTVKRADDEGRDILVVRAAATLLPAHPEPFTSFSDYNPGN